MTNDKCREKFEVWCKRLPNFWEPYLEQDEHGYRFGTTAADWEVWQAAWNHTPTPPADIVKPQLNSAKDFNCVDMQEAKRLLAWASDILQEHNISADNWHNDYLWWEMDACSKK